MAGFLGVAGRLPPTAENILSFRRERVFLRVPDGIGAQVNVQKRPVQMLRGRHFHGRDLFYRRPPEPGNFAKRAYVAAVSLLVFFLRCSFPPRLPVERVMGCFAAPFSGSFALEPPFFPSFPSSGRRCPG